MRDDREPALGIRLTVAAVAAVVLLVPFAVIAFVVARNLGWLHRVDLAVTDAFHRYAVTHAGWVRFMSACSAVFAPLTWRVAAGLVVIWLLLRRRAWPPALWVAVTMTAGGTLGALLKLLVGRHRPALLDPVARAPGYSFPSGHALNSALGATVLLLVLMPLVRRPLPRMLLLVAAVVFPLLTGVSRIALGVHWTSDVVAGWLLGVAVAVVTAWVFLAWQERRRRVEGHRSRAIQ